MLPGLVAGSEDHNRGFRRMLYLLVWLVIVPTAMLLALSIVTLVWWGANIRMLFGILVVTFVSCVVTGGVLLIVFVRREASLSKLQLDFVSKVSHELRTPLTSIRMFAEMLQQSRDPEQTATCLAVLQKETIRLSDRIERLLDWGRMEAGRRVYELRRERPEVVLDAALASFATHQVGRPQLVKLELARDLPEVVVDRDALVDAIVNLLSNAVKYTPEEKRISLSCRSDAGVLRIAVTDNGIGIAKREHGRIFQKFYRVDDRLSREVEGSGLGLAIVRHVAEAHRGRVEVESEPGRGATFSLLLPLPSAKDLNAQLETERAVAS
ncbi:MAG: GHKL domain-containing protein [Deltaproteobacteria bacterium]|nr:GHKL domain-containing protein [Deltaproteobacteria bacterium]